MTQRPDQRTVRHPFHCDSAPTTQRGQVADPARPFGQKGDSLGKSKVLGLGPHPRSP
jgi:hypothetical protein